MILKTTNTINIFSSSAIFQVTIYDLKLIYNLINTLQRRNLRNCFEERNITTFWLCTHCSDVSSFIITFLLFLVDASQLLAVLINYDCVTQWPVIKYGSLLLVRSAALSLGRRKLFITRPHNGGTEAWKVLNYTAVLSSPYCK